MPDRKVVEMSRGTQSNLMFCVINDPTGDTDYRVFVGEPIAASDQSTFLPGYKLLRMSDRPRCPCHGRVYTILYMGTESDLDLVEGCEPLDPEDYVFEEDRRGVLITKKQ